MYTHAKPTFFGTRDRCEPQAGRRTDGRSVCRHAYITRRIAPQRTQRIAVHRRRRRRRFRQRELSSYRVDSLFLSLPCLALPSCHYYRRSFIFFFVAWLFSPRFFSHARFSIKQKHEHGPSSGMGRLAWRRDEEYVIPGKSRNGRCRYARKDTGNSSRSRSSLNAVCAIGLETGRRTHLGCA